MSHGYLPQLAEPDLRQRPDAVPCFCLDLALTAGMFGFLTDLLHPRSRVGEIAGDGDWSLAWDRDKAEMFDPDAVLLAEVDPETFRATQQTGRTPLPEFLDLLECGLAEYRRRPGRYGLDGVPQLERVIAMVRTESTHRTR